MVQSRNPSLVVFLGAGGVGKTTLSAGFALALAQNGKNVVLMSIDPARRLQSALSAGELRDEAAQLSLPKGFMGKFYASQLNVEQAFGRWIREQGMPPETERRLRDHVFFQTLVQRFATMGDAFAAVRIAEIVEQMPDIDFIVVDTAPGIHAVDFLAKPERVLEFLNSRAFEFFKLIGGGGGIFSRAIRLGTGRFLDLLGSIGGEGFLSAFSELLVLSQDVFGTMSKRLEKASVLMRSNNASFVVVSAVREDALQVSHDLCAALREQEVDVSLAVLNRTVASELQADSGFATFLRDTKDSNEEERVFANYVSGWIAKQDSARARLASLGVCVAQVPLVPGLDSAASFRLNDLAVLGRPVLAHFRTHRWGSS